MQIKIIYANARGRERGKIAKRKYQYISRNDQGRS